MMGYALLWVEGLAVALLCLALAAAWASARGSFFRAAGLVVVFLIFFGLAAAATLAAGALLAHAGERKWPLSDLFGYTLAWLLVYLLAAIILLRRAFHRPGPGLARAGAGWPRTTLWLGLGGAVLALGLTFWNLDLAARADLAVARQEAGDILLTLAPPPADSDQAARLFHEAEKDLVAPIRNPWRDAVTPWRSGQKPEEPNWKDPYVVELVAGQEKVLALLRQAAALPPSSRTPHSLDLGEWQSDRKRVELRWNERTLLAVDARVKAVQGNPARALEDVVAILGFTRHSSEMLAGPETLGTEFLAWRTLEEVLRLTPATKDGLPAVTFPEVISPLCILLREMAVFGMIWPAVFSDDPLRIPELGNKLGPWSTPPLVYLTETLVIPGCRILFTPGELTYSHRKWDEYRRILRGPPEAKPRDWAAVRNLVETEPASAFSARYVKPKEQVLLREAGRLAALEHLARAGLAAARYRDKHGKYPERLEQLVPAFLPAMPVDPRDGQLLRVKHFPDVTVLYTTADSPGLETARSWDPETYSAKEPIFRLYPRAAPQ
jgi:hypothetical protein